MTKKTRLSLTLTLSLALAPALAVLLVAGGASAAPAAETSLSLRDVPLRHRGLALSVGGGVTDYSDRQTRDLLGSGGYWEVRGLFGTRSYLGSELAYVGSSRAFSASAAPGDAHLMTNGVEAAMRLNLPLQFTDLRVTPFIFVGPGYAHLSVVNADVVPPGMKSSDDVFVFSSGGGCTVTYQQMVLGARFTYRQLRGADLIQVGTEKADLQNWSLGLTMGYEI